MAVVAEMRHSDNNAAAFRSSQHGAWNTIRQFPHRIKDMAGRIAGAGKNPEKPYNELTPDLIERWKNLPARVIPYDPGTCRDRITPYPGGKRLLIGIPGQEEQVMDSFELPWVQETVKEMWGSRGIQNVAERGFGMGLMSEEIHKKMTAAQKTQIARGGIRQIKPQIHVIAELNKFVFENAKTWAREKLDAAKLENRPLRIRFIDAEGNEEQDEYLPEGINQNALVELRVINGDADEVMLKFSQASFDLIFSDTHQLAPQFLGLHDILKLNKLKLLLRKNGRFTFLAWHRNNTTGDVDPEQRRRISHDFTGYRVRVPGEAEVIIPRDCEYLDGSKLILPIVICENPRMN